MAFRLPILVLVGFCFSISAASPARADTIPVTSGARFAGCTPDR